MENKQTENNETLLFEVGGKEFKVQTSLFANVYECQPSYFTLLLSNLSKFKRTDKYEHPDRDSEVFERIINFYKTGVFDRKGIDKLLLKEELEFWQVSIPEETEKDLNNDFINYAVYVIKKLVEIFISKQKRYYHFNRLG